MATIETKHGTLMVVPVPEDSTNHRINGSLHYDRANQHENSLGDCMWVSIPENSTILGTCTSTEISFDVEPYVSNNGLGCYDNYKGIADNRYTLLNAPASFRSLLASHGIYFTNPLGEEPKRSRLMICSTENPEYINFEGLAIKWREAQSKVINKAVIIRVK